MALQDINRKLYIGNKHCNLLPNLMIYHYTRVKTTDTPSQVGDAAGILSEKINTRIHSFKIGTLNVNIRLQNQKINP